MVNDSDCNSDEEGRRIHSNRRLETERPKPVKTIHPGSKRDSEPRRRRRHRKRRGRRVGVGKDQNLSVTNDLVRHDEDNWMSFEKRRNLIFQDSINGIAAGGFKKVFTNSATRYNNATINNQNITRETKCFDGKIEIRVTPPSCRVNFREESNYSGDICETDLKSETVTSGLGTYATVRGTIKEHENINIDHGSTEPTTSLQFKANQGSSSCENESSVNDNAGHFSCRTSPGKSEPSYYQDSNVDVESPSCSKGAALNDEETTVDFTPSSKDIKISMDVDDVNIGSGSTPCENKSSKLCEDPSIKGQGSAFGSTSVHLEGRCGSVFSKSDENNVSIYSQSITNNVRTRKSKNSRIVIVPQTRNDFKELGGIFNFRRILKSNKRRYDDSRVMFDNNTIRSRISSRAVDEKPPRPSNIQDKVPALWADIIHTPELWKTEQCPTKRRKHHYDNRMEELESDRRDNYEEMLVDFVNRKEDRHVREVGGTLYEKRLRERLEHPEWRYLVEEFDISPAKMEVLHARLSADQSAEHNLREVCSLQSWPPPSYHLCPGPRPGASLASCTVKGATLSPGRPAYNSHLARELAAAMFLDWLGVVPHNYDHLTYF